mmetsp:Transcript_39132/g.81873  ORF Transcript_39132/g.81873 Transcript_39132/m.81873 type:complete len:276 (+) Transcript_39132:61-888(+)
MVYSPPSNCDDFSKFLDVDPLQLSGHGGLDDFDFAPKEDGAGGERLPFTGSSGSNNEFEGLLFDSLGSAGMDFQFETLESCDAIDFHASQGNRDCLSSPRPNHKHQQFQVQMDTVNFDPPAQQQEKEQQQKQQDVNQNQRQESYSDLSMCSMQNSSAPSSDQQVSDSASIHQCSKSKLEYKVALRNLAKSMKRSEMTRRHVMMQRDMLPPDQQRALYLAKERLDQQNRLALRQQSSSTVATSFFNRSSGGSFASKMEQSRKRITMYMGQVNHGTL